MALSTVPARLDALRWSPWHTRVVLALGITWILDGLEASLVASLGPSLQAPHALGMSAADVGLTSSVYLLGQVLGALGFGYLTDRAGRKKLFLVTLGLYLGATAACGLAPNLTVFAALRFLAGAGIGGEYAAINSAIDELVPASVRGRVDLGINGSYWVGVALGALLTVVVLDPSLVPQRYGWRLAFGAGAILGLVILLVRRHVPESPRWLLMHARRDEAEKIMREIEAQAGQSPQVTPVDVAVSGTVSLRALFETVFVKHRRRAVLALALMLAQTYFYNAIFFSHGLILERFHHVDAARVGLYVLPFALGNFVGPLALGHFFDTLGRRVMIPLTYALSGLLLIVTGWFFLAGWLDARTQTLCWCAVFFFASSAASAAYLTVSELFPVHVRGMAIALFYAAGTLAGATAPWLFGWLVQGGDPRALFGAYVFAGALMLVAAIIARVFGVASEGRSLEALSEA